MTSETSSAAGVAYWGLDRRESTTRKRVRMLSDAGAAPLALLFDRGAGAAPPVAAAIDVDLGRTEDAAHGQRLGALLVARGRARRALRAAGWPKVQVARNLDMLLLALAATAFAPRRARARVVYECLDIHRALTGDGLKSRLLRWIERRALAHVDAVAVSSEAFLRAYFEPRQGWRGASVLLENRIYAPDVRLERPTAPRAAAEGGPLVVVWPGNLRCQVTLDLFKHAAAALGERVLFRLHGVVQAHAIRDFDAQIAGFPNIRYEGPFRFPDGLAEVYRGAHLVWAQDLWRRGGNSDWLIPNRLYEGGFYGVPAVAVVGSETGRITAARGLGYVLEDAAPSTVTRFFAEVDRREVLTCQRRLLAAPRETFETTREAAAAEAAALIGAETGGAPTQAPTGRAAAARLGGAVPAHPGVKL